MPKRKQSKSLTPRFDLSDSPAEDIGSKPPAPAEAKRPKRAKRISSEGKLNAEAAGEISVRESPPVPVGSKDVIESRDEEEVLDEKDMLEVAEQEPEQVIEMEAEPQSEEERAELADEDREWEARIHAAKMGEMKGVETPLSFEVRDLGNAFEAAKQDYERVAEEVGARAKSINEGLAERGFPADTLMIWSEAIQQREGLPQKLFAAMDKMSEARKAYEEAYEKWEKQLAKNEQAKSEMEAVVDQLIKENPSQAAQETAEETIWYDRGEKAWKESDEIADVRREIAGNELEEPIGTPGDLALLGFDQPFIDTYRETQERLEKAEAAKGKAGFFKKLFGGAKLEREYESARSDFESLQEDVMNRRTAREKASRESVMTPAQIEAQRKSDEIKMRGIAARGH